MCHILSESTYSVANKGETTQFHRFFPQIYHSVMAPPSTVRKKWNADAQQQTFPYYTILSQEAHLYRRGTARHAILVNSCYVSRWELQKFQIANVTFKVIQGHWQWCHSIGHIRFHISLPLQLCLYLSLFPRYYHLFPKL